MNCIRSNRHGIKPGRIVSSAPHSLVSPHLRQRFFMSNLLPRNLLRSTWRHHEIQRLSLAVSFHTGGQEAVADQDGLPRRRKHIRNESPRARLILGTLDYRYGILGDDVHFRWDLDNHHRVTNDRGYVCGVYNAGIGFTQLDFRGDLPDVRFLGNEVCQNAFRKISAKGGILAHLLQCLSGIIAYRDLFIGENELDVGFGQILQSPNTRWVLGRNDHNQ